MPISHNSDSGYYERLPTSEHSHAQPGDDEPIDKGPFAYGSCFQSPRRHLDKISVTTREFLKINYGLLLVIGAQALLTLVNVAVKKLNSIDPPVPVLELIVIRMAMTYVFCMGYMHYAGVPDPFLGPKGVRLLLLLRGSCGFLGIFGVYQALQYLSLSDATVLTFLAPLCTSISGAIFLKEKFAKGEAIAGVFSLAGVVLIARPVSLFGSAAQVQMPEISLDTLSEKGTSAQRIWAVCISLVGVLGSTGAYTSIRAIGKRAHHMHSMMSFAGQASVMASVGMVVTRTTWVLPLNWFWLLLLVEIGVFGFLAQVLLTMGLQREAAGRATMGVYSQVVFATIFERLWFHSQTSILSIIGTLIILGSALYVALTKEREGVKEDITIILERLDDTSLEEGLLEQSRREADGKPTEEADLPKGP